MSIRARMALLVALNIIVFAGIGAANLLLYSSHKNNINENVGHLKAVRACLDMGEALSRMRREEKNYMLFREEKHLVLLKKAIEEADKTLTELQITAVKYPDIQKTAAAISEVLEKYKSSVAALRGMTEGKFLQLTLKAREMTEEIEDNLDEAETLISAKIAEKMSEYLHLLKIYMFFMLGGLVVATAAWLSAGLWFWFSVHKRMDKLAVAARRMMLGEYQPVVETGPMDEVGQLAMAFDEMRQKIAERGERIEKLNADLIKLTNQLKRG